MIECYQIVSITDKECIARTDGRYPLRIGRYCSFPACTPGTSMCIWYIANADGSKYENMRLITSKVVSAHYDSDFAIISTLNSIYTFEKVKLDETLL